MIRTLFESLLYYLVAKLFGFGFWLFGFWVLGYLFFLLVILVIWFGLFGFWVFGSFTKGITPSSQHTV